MHRNALVWNNVSPTLPLSQSEASIESLDSTVKKEAIVYSSALLSIAALPQWVPSFL